MSGHSKWANIKNRKGKQDAVKGKIFTKMAKLIAVAAKEGGGDPERNAKLREAVAKAKAANMPNDNIDRAIKKGAGELDNTIYEEINYEGYGPGGVAVIVQVLTDNKNRTAGDVRHAFDKKGVPHERSAIGHLFRPPGENLIHLQLGDGLEFVFGALPQESLLAEVEPRATGQHRRQRQRQSCH